MTDYLNRDFEPIEPDRLEQLGPEEQREVMEVWFRRNFEDPAEHMPYESREGGYIWIWGGPYDAADELHAEFGGLIDETVIEALASDLTDECWQWAPTVESLGDDAFLDVLAASRPFRDFETRMAQLEALVELECEDELQQAHYQVLAAAGVSALEAYLVERTVRGVRQDRAALRRFVENFGTFKEHKVPVAEVLKMAAGIEDYVTNVLASMVWHRLDKVRRVMRDAFELDEFPETRELESIIEIRHDVVHRAGRNRDGEPIELDDGQVSHQFQVIKSFIGELEAILPLDEEGDLAFRSSTNPNEFVRLGDPGAS